MSFMSKRAVSTVIMAVVVMTSAACSKQTSTAAGPSTSAASGPETTGAGTRSASTAKAQTTTGSSPDSSGNDDGGGSDDRTGSGSDSGGGSDDRTGSGSGEGGDAETITPDEILRQWDAAAGGSDSLNLCVHNYIVANVRGPVTKIEAETTIKIGVQECLQDLKEESEVPVPTIIYPK